MLRTIKATAVAEVGIGQSECGSFRIHEHDKLLFITADMFHRGQTGIIGRHDQHGFEQVFEFEHLSWTEPKMRFRRPRGIATDGRLII